MRLNFALITASALFVTPAFAHPEHGFQLPDLLHIVTEADHLAIAAGAIALLLVISRFAFKRSGK